MVLTPIYSIFDSHLAYARGTATATVKERLDVPKTF